MMPDVINQRYRVEYRYLSVKAGVLYRAYDLRLYRPVMIWMLPESSTYRQKRLLEEISIISGLKHENIVELYGHEVDVKTGQLFLILKFLDCRALSDTLAQSSPQPLPKELALNIAVGVLTAVQAAHEVEIAHRRINPYNIFLLQNNVQLAGFGLAHLQDLSSLTAEEILYMSPEQLEGQLGDESADLYSIGVFMFQIFTGELPFYAVSIEDLRRCISENRPELPHVVNPQVSQLIEDIILGLLQEDPNNRYQTAAHVLDALQPE